jgi:hypothetical protein
MFDDARALQLNEIFFISILEAVIDLHTSNRRANEFYVNFNKSSNEFFSVVFTI